MQKYKIAVKILESLQNKSENSTTTYLMVFGGSSVTAGHDNYYYQSHPFVFERRLKDIFKSIGIDLLVRNIAQGANNCLPYNYCYEAMGGFDADFIMWEQSFNCGRDRGIFELMARNAYWYGAVIYYMASGGYIPSICPKSKEKFPRIHEDWTPQQANITMEIPFFTLDNLKKYKILQNKW